VEGLDINRMKIVTPFLHVPNVVVKALDIPVITVIEKAQV
jgi:hypothetical protein